MWGEIIKGGLGLLGGLFGKKKQKTETTVNYQQMVASAEAAGFNPLTAIRNGGSAGFTTTTSPTVSQMPEALANFGGVLGSALEKKLDPIEAKKREIDTLMTDVQLKEARALAARPASFYRPLEWSGTKVSNQFVPRLGEKSHKQAAAVPGVTASSKKNEPIDMFVEGRGLNGEKLITVNPDVADLDQFLVPVASQWLTSGRDFSRGVKNKAKEFGNAVSSGFGALSSAGVVHRNTSDTRRFRPIGRGAMAPPARSGGGGY